jgi:hypothetical protein
MTLPGPLWHLVSVALFAVVVPACTSKDEPLKPPADSEATEAELLEKIRTLSEQIVARRKQMETKQLVYGYPPLYIDRCRAEFRRLPPMSVEELRVADDIWKGLHAEDTTNESSEVLLVALRHPEFSAPLKRDALPGDKPLGDTDLDMFNQIPAGLSSLEAREILDAWGNPIVYFHKDGYGRTATIVNRWEKEVEVHPVKRPGGVFYNHKTYQIISVGPNGVQDVPGSEDYDDIMNFRLSQK